ncbi:MAG: OB-fold nucleic acid binding domain-containing protein, partial [Propionibacteriaceae bacterium]|nr:OB-fold nucleic acid binding domain-containing protein [Propionibacteriaceae bacterium]
SVDSHNKYARRKTGREPIESIHPELDEPLAEILGETYGLIVYQEQVALIAQKLAGYTLGAADALRRAMGRKSKKELDAQYDVFRSGMLERGYSEDAFQTIWDILVSSSSYAFNKSHSVAYGLLSYQSAWLRANYPVEFMAALLQSVRDDDDTEKPAVYLAECRRMGITVLPPDVNASDGLHTVVGPSIRLGLAAIRNIDESVAQAIVEARSKHGCYGDFYSFLRIVQAEACDKRFIASLVKAGAFDSLGHTRRALMEILENAVDHMSELKRRESNGLDDLRSSVDVDPCAANPTQRSVPELDEWESRTKLAFEREVLGLYVSGHPLSGLEDALSGRTAAIADLIVGGVAKQGERVVVCGIITQVQRRQTKQGRAWASITVEDTEASINVLLFPSVFEGLPNELTLDSIVRVEGRADVHDGVVELRADSMTILNTD